MNLISTFVFALVVCFAVVNAGRYHSAENARKYEDNYDDKESSGGEPGGEPGPEAEKEGEDGGEPSEEKEGENHDGDLAGDTDAEKHKGYCHWGIAVWFKPGFAQKCSCMRCICQKGGNWKCDYYFPYCPYFYCNNVIFNPRDQLCCCGKVHDKKADHACCGYNYFDKRHSKCCNYYSVKPIKSECPRDRI